MIAHRKNFVPSLFILIIFFEIAGVPPWGNSTMAEDNVLIQVESKSQCLMHRLMMEGFEVTPAHFRVQPVEEYSSHSQVMGLRRGNESAAPPLPNLNKDDVGIHPFSVGIQFMERAPCGREFYWKAEILNPAITNRRRL